MKRTRAASLAHAALAALSLLPLAAAPAAAQQGRRDRGGRRSAILFIGDGMGVSQVTLGRLGAQALGRPYHLDRFTTLGLASTRSASHVVTDSAAAATALAAGVKTYNYAIGLDPFGVPRETILDLAHAAGYATGLVTTTRLTHATPAAFATHQRHRDDEDPIAQQLATRGYPDVLIGGGLRHFPDERQDLLRRGGYTVALDPAALRSATGPRVAAFLAESHLPFAVERPDGFPSLRDLTARAVELLSARGQPFFLMVEGGRIDHACHHHDAIGALHDQLDFDAAVGFGLDRAQQDPSLLVVVTADHATGDLGISDRADVPVLLEGRASSEALTASPVDPRRPEEFADFATRVRGATGVELAPSEVEQVWAHPEDEYWARTFLGHVVSARYGVHFYDVATQERELTNTHGHDGAMVMVYAAGNHADRFAGTYENTEIPRRMASLLGLPEPGRALVALVRTPSGLQVADLSPGEGPALGRGQLATVHYTGWLTDGTRFDSSRDRDEPLRFPLGVRRLIAGFEEGVTGMRPGGRRTLVVPAALAYGDLPVGPIPAGSTIVFEVELLSVAGLH